MATSQRNKQTFIRRDANGVLIPGSAVQRVTKPKFGSWYTVPETYECCNFTTTTTEA